MSEQETVNQINNTLDRLDNLVNVYNKQMEDEGPFLSSDKINSTVEQINKIKAKLSEIESNVGHQF